MLPCQQLTKAIVERVSFCLVDGWGRWGEGNMFSGRLGAMGDVFPKYYWDDLNTQRRPTKAAKSGPVDRAHIKE